MSMVKGWIYVPCNVLQESSVFLNQVQIRKETELAFGDKVGLEKKGNVFLFVVGIFLKKKRNTFLNVDLGW